MMNDEISSLGSSLIQHGKDNDRLYLMKMSPLDFPEIIDECISLAQKKDYGKIFAKIPAAYFPAFQMAGFNMEAFVPSFYADGDDAVFICKYLHNKRGIINKADFNQLQELISQKLIVKSKPDPNLQFRPLGVEDIPKMVDIYKTVFPRYPFPIHDPYYIRKTMQEDVFYIGAFEKGKLIALASAEQDTKNHNAEMTDFAVLPEARGKGLALQLLIIMEERIKQWINTAYTIARIKSPGMIKTFLKAGYQFSGALINNTHISSGMESMAVLYKELSKL